MHWLSKANKFQLLRLYVCQFLYLYSAYVRGSSKVPRDRKITCHQNVCHALQLHRGPT
jgi:hypothetical protein